jgi:4-hydroxy-tetrahydrodipicolinate synthase
MDPIAKKLSGTGVALVTPFHKNGAVDFDALTRLVNHILKGKCEYLVVLGTTGESVTLSTDEKRAVVDCVLAVNRNRVPLVLGLGGNDTAGLVRKLETSDFTGISALLSVSPYYNKPTQKGLIQHYTKLAKASPLPMLLYNVPARTGSNLHQETVLRLANDIPSIIGIKEASGSMEQAMDIIRQRPDGFLVISGDDALTLPLLAAGADGVISVVANAFPREFSEMVRQALKSNFKKARELHYDLLPIVPMLFEEGNPAGVKCALKMLGICDEHLRLPLVPVSRQLAQQIQLFCAHHRE